MDWPYEIAERDHELQNPTSAEKIRLLGEYLRLGRDSRVLDIACGKAGPALVLASTFGCRVVGVELRSQFADEARARIAASGLESLVDVHTADAATFRSKLGRGTQRSASARASCGATSAMRLQGWFRP